MGVLYYVRAGLWRARLASIGHHIAVVFQLGSSSVVVQENITPACFPYLDAGVSRCCNGIELRLEYLLLNNTEQRL